MSESRLPKPASSSTIEAFQKLVRRGEFCLFASFDVPPDIPKAGSNCQAVVVAASVMHSSDVPGLTPPLTPSGTVFLWRGFRTQTSGSPSRKVDDCLYYQSSDGKAWSLHSKASTDHHRNILTSTGMKGLIDDWDLPSLPKGTLDQYRSAGGNLSFFKPFGWSSELGEDGS